MACVRLLQKEKKFIFFYSRLSHSFGETGFCFFFFSPCLSLLAPSHIFSILCSSPELQRGPEQWCTLCHSFSFKHPSVQSDPVYSVCIDGHSVSATVVWVSIHLPSLTHHTAPHMSAAAQRNGVMSPMTVLRNRLWIGNVGVSIYWKYCQCLIGGYNVVLEHSFLCSSVGVAPLPYMVSKIYCLGLQTCVERCSLCSTIQVTFQSLSLINGLYIHWFPHRYAMCDVELIIREVYHNTQSLFIFRGGGAQTSLVDRNLKISVVTMTLVDSGFLHFAVH